MQHLTVGGRVANHTVLANLFTPCLKLRLHKADAHCIRRGDGLRHRENMVQRDEGDIHTEELDRVCQILRLHIADVGALHVYHPLIGAQAPCQLPIAHIHCVDLDCTVLQHTVGEAAGRGTDIHADLAFGCEGEALHCLFQLQTAPADIADIVPADFHLGVLFDHLTGFVHLLFIDKDHAGHDHCLCPFAALDHTMLN